MHTNQLHAWLCLVCLVGSSNAMEITSCVPDVAQSPSLQNVSDNDDSTKGQLSGGSSSPEICNLDTVEQKIIDKGRYQYLVWRGQKDKPYLTGSATMVANADSISSYCTSIGWERNKDVYVVSRDEQDKSCTKITLSKRLLDNSNTLRPLKEFISKYPIHTMAVSPHTATIALGHDNGLSLIPIEHDDFAQPRKVRWSERGALHTLAFDQDGTNVLGLISHHRPGQDYSTSKDSWLVRYHISSKTMHMSKIQLEESCAQRARMMARYIVLGCITGGIIPLLAESGVFLALDAAGVSDEVQVAAATSTAVAGVLGGAAVVSCIPYVRRTHFYYKPSLLYTPHLQQRFMLAVRPDVARELSLPPVSNSNLQALSRAKYILQVLKKEEHKNQLLEELNNHGFDKRQKAKLSKLINAE